MPALPLVDALPPRTRLAGLLDRLAPAGGIAFLDSAASAGGMGRWSILAIAPYDVVRLDAGAAIDPRLFDRLEGSALPRLDRAPGPFQGGAIGWISYDLARRFESLPAAARDDLATPDIHFGLHDLFLVQDHRCGSSWVVSTGDPERRGALRLARARSRLQDARALLSRDAAAAAMPFRCGPPESTHDRDAYAAAVREALRWIERGHVYQINLSRRFTLPFDGDPLAFYRRLRLSNPAPFAACIDAGDRVVLSSSPERFLRTAGGRIETRPIKGTRRRDRDPAVDRRLAQELIRSPKDRAELTMIVDLLRNDLGRICEFGTVRTESLGHLESFETVHHLVGVVTGDLRPGTGFQEILRATFPGGSITGAPKIRAMELIEAMEPFRRGVAYGAIGYVGRGGEIDLNIAIRTAVLRSGLLRFHVGGGIVSDSDPDAEFEETLHKAEGILRAIGRRPAEPAPVASLREAR